jgi:predicted HicB family RNase H-like nuclease
MGLKPLKKKESLSIEEVIDRGGDVAADKAQESEQAKKEWKNFNLRIREDLLDQIDEAVKDRVGISKTAWILEAIQEKLRNQNDR